MEREGNSIHAILTDVEMPNMDGLELTRRVRKVERWSKMPIIAITSMTGDEAMRKGLDAGVDRYIVKLDRERIVQAIEEVFLSKER